MPLLWLASGGPSEPVTTHMTRPERERERKRAKGREGRGTDGEKCIWGLGQAVPYRLFRRLDGISDGITDDAS